MITATVMSITSKPRVSHPPISDKCRQNQLASYKYHRITPNPASHYISSCDTSISHSKGYRKCDIRSIRNISGSHRIGYHKYNIKPLQNLSKIPVISQVSFFLTDGLDDLFVDDHSSPLSLDIENFAICSCRKCPRKHVLPQLTLQQTSADFPFTACPDLSPTVCSNDHTTTPVVSFPKHVPPISPGTPDRRYGNHQVKNVIEATHGLDSNTNPVLALPRFTPRQASTAFSFTACPDVVDCKLDYMTTPVVSFSKHIPMVSPEKSPGTPAGRYGNHRVKDDIETATHRLGLNTNSVLAVPRCIRRPLNIYDLDEILKM